MKVFLTGASGFLGMSLIPKLILAGHQVAGLSRSRAGADSLATAGASVINGDVNDLMGLRRAAEGAAAVVHLAFSHDRTALKQSSENDRKVIAALGEVAHGSGQTLIVTSGTGIVRSKPGLPAKESDGHVNSSEYPRAASEEAADQLIEKGVKLIVVRLSQVHNSRKQGRITEHVELARKWRRAAYIGNGRNCVPAVHLSDAVQLYLLALEKGEGGAHYHAVDEEGVSSKDIAHAIGLRLKVPVEAITSADAPAYFGPLAALAAMHLPASSVLTRQELSWRPLGPSLLTDLGMLDHDGD